MPYWAIQFGVHWGIALNGTHCTTEVHNAVMNRLRSVHMRLAVSASQFLLGVNDCADVTLVLRRVHVGYTVCANLGYLHFKANSFSTFHRGRTLVQEFTNVYDEYFSGLNKILDS
nr:hypothetical protein Iba_chr03dCG1280 [Ipomoea batatas]